MWRDTEARSLSTTVDALGKLAQMLNVPVEELWERVPGVTKTDVDRWRKAAERARRDADAMEQLNRMLDRQLNSSQPGEPGEPGAAAGSDAGEVEREAAVAVAEPAG